MPKKVINMEPYKSGDMYTGRPEGYKVRELLNLDEFDKKEDEEIVFSLPKDTTSLNPSFYLGLLFKSYQKLGESGVKSKYSFQFETESEARKTVLTINLEDGNRNALLFLNTDGLDEFFNS